MTKEELHYRYLNAIKPDRIEHEIAHLEEEKARIQKDLVRRFIHFGQTFRLDPETFVNRFTNASATQRDMNALEQIGKDLELLYGRLSDSTF